MPLRLFLPITKVDVEQRTVYGRAVQEVPDKAAEVFDYASSKPLFSAWSETIAKATEGKNLGNVRAMHGKVAAGKLTELAFNDDEKAIDVAAKVVDDAEWQKCLEGVYTGFSIGGKYAKRWQDEANPALMRYTAEPSEISLVDNPCVPTATFTMLKADGTSETKPFQRLAVLKALLEDSALTLGELLGLMDEYLPSDAAQKLAGTETTTLGEVKTALRKFAAEAPTEAAPSDGDDAEKVARRKDTTPTEGESTYGDVAFADPTNKKYPIDTVPHIRAAWNYINKAKNAAKYSAKDVKAIKARIVAAWKAKIDADGPPAATQSEKLAKGIWSLQQFVGLLDQVRWLADDAEYEAITEGDGSPVPAKLRGWLRTGAEILGEMTEEELSEMLAGMRGAEKGDLSTGDLAKALADTIAARPELSAHGVAEALRTGALDVEDAVAKAGARHSKKDRSMLQTIHDHAVDLGADCVAMDTAKAARGEAPTQDDDRFTKLATDVASLTECLTKMTGERDALQARVQQLEDQPAPPKGVAKVVHKEHDYDALPTGDHAENADDPIALMKAAHQRPLLISTQ